MKILIISLAFLLLSCGVFAQGQKTLKVLSIGNSFSHDGFSYVPFLMKEIAPEVDLTFAIAAIGGCTLEQHDTYSKDKEPRYDFHKYVPGATTWINKNPVHIKEALTEENWDIIILQQQSQRSQDYATCQPFLDNFISYIYDNVSSPVKLAWHLTPSYGHIGNEGIEMFEKISVTSQKVMENTPCQILIPNGTAIQNARGTYLKDLGDQKHMSGDNLHMQNGLPRQIEAYTTILVLLNECGMGYRGIYGNKTICDDKWLEDKLTWTTGKSVGSVPENLPLAQKCAIEAVKHPFTVTEIK